MIEIEPASMKPSGRCACCGKSKHTAWGFVYEDDAPRACYFVEWVAGHSIATARFDVVVGRWSDDTTESDRTAVSLDYRSGSFELADAEGRPAAEVGRATKKDDVAGTPLADEVLNISRAVLAGDDRFRELAKVPS
jgi:hypothetical protein